MKKVELVKDKEGKVIRKKVSTINKKPSMTDQSYKDQVNAKLIVKHYLKTGLMTHLNQTAGEFKDVSEVKNLYESMVKVKQAEKFFMDLPSEIRKELDNDPQKMLEVIVDPKLEQEAIKLGLKQEKEDKTQGDIVAPGVKEGDKDVKNTKTDSVSS